MSDAAAQCFQRICSAQIARGADGRAWVIARRDEALAKIAAGAGELVALNAGGANGKTFGGEIQLTPLDVAELAQAALDLADGTGTGPTGITVPSFGYLPTNLTIPPFPFWEQ